VITMWTALTDAGIDPAHITGPGPDGLYTIIRRSGGGYIVVGYSALHRDPATAAGAGDWWDYTIYDHEGSAYWIDGGADLTAVAASVARLAEQ